MHQTISWVALLLLGVLVACGSDVDPAIGGDAASDCGWRHCCDGAGTIASGDGAVTALDTSCCTGGPKVRSVCRHPSVRRGCPCRSDARSRNPRCAGLAAVPEVAWTPRTGSRALWRTARRQAWARFSRGLPPALISQGRGQPLRAVARGRTARSWDREIRSTWSDPPSSRSAATLMEPTRAATPTPPPPAQRRPRARHRRRPTGEKQGMRLSWLAPAPPETVARATRWREWLAPRRRGLLPAPAGRSDRSLPVLFSIAVSPLRFVARGLPARKGGIRLGVRSTVSPSGMDTAYRFELG